MSHRILLVDDDKDVRSFLRLALEQENYQVAEASDGLTAIGQLQVLSFDAVLLDLSMPRLDGVATLNTIQRLQKEHAVPVIVISGQDDAETRQQVAAAGAAGFFPKPIQPSAVLALLNDLFAEADRS